MCFIRAMKIASVAEKKIKKHDNAGFVYFCNASYFHTRETHKKVFYCSNITSKWSYFTA